MNLFRRNRAAAAEPTSLKLVDISNETFGKYQHGTQYDGVWYADSDFDEGYGMGKPKVGSIPAPSEEDRTPFGQKRKPVTVETETQKMKRWQTERQETHTLLERLAAELVEDVRIEQPQWFEKFTAEYERDVAGYSFECRRHGAFLTLFITRSGNPQTDHPFAMFGARPMERTLATTINLGDCREIRFIPGHPPDLFGNVKFGYSMKHESGATIGGTSFGNYAASKGSQWVVSKPQCWLPHGRPLCELDPPIEKNRGPTVHMDDNSYKIRTVVDKAARLADDDRIRFEGIGTTLYAPASLGESVHESILKALE